MSTQLRNVPNCQAQNELTQTRFYGGSKRGTCVQVTSGDGKQFLQLTREQADQLSRELALFAEGREVEEFEDCGGDDHHAVEVNADTMAHLANSN